jgi:aspartyl-tRNA(Asn)/glutamyl-tRNA(Gln) amidotransferase subunit C
MAALSPEAGRQPARGLSSFAPRAPCLAAPVLQGEAESCALRFPPLYGPQTIPEPPMSVDLATVKRVAKLSRIAVSEVDAIKMMGELNGILGFVEQLDAVDVSGVEPLTSVVPTAMRRRADAVTDGGKSQDIVANAPVSDENFFLVPKVVE